MRKLFITALAFAVVWPAVAKDSGKNPSAIGERNVSGHVNFFSVERELALGKQLAIEVEKQARIVDDPVISEYVNRLGQNLARNSDVAFPLTFKVIESDEVNAFTLPGGYIFVDSGLLRITGNESQLAAALAHEIAHAAARHATRQVTRNQLVSLASIPLGVFGGLGGLLAGPAANLAGAMAVLRFSREFETEADMLGLQYLWKAGYDPDASVELFEILASTERRRPGSLAKLFSEHPLTPDRIQKTQKNIDKMLPPRTEYVINTSEYEEVRARLGTISKSEPEKPAPPTLKRQ